jgi:hypothetical protein
MVLVDASTDEIDGLSAPGWLKRGPAGIIGTDVVDSKDRVASICQDVQSPASPKLELSFSLQE